MTFRRSDLQEAFFVPGTHGLRVWGYGAADSLENVLALGGMTRGKTLIQGKNSA